MFEPLVLPAATPDRLPARAGLYRRKALVDKRYREAKPALQLARKALGASAEFVALAVEAERQPDHEVCWPPLRDEFPDRLETRLQVAGLERRQRLCDAGSRIAHRNADEALAEVECEHGARARSTHAPPRRPAWRKKRRVAPSLPASVLRKADRR